MNSQIETRSKLVEKLRQQILQDAITGKLSEKWRKDNSNLESAKVLLEKIQAEKEKLIKAGMYKRGQTIPNIKTITSIGIPASWAYTKLDDLFFVTKLAGFEYTKYIRLLDSGDVPVIRAQNVKSFLVEKSKLKYIDLETSELLERSALTKDCLLVTFIGAGIGDVALFKEERRWHLAPNVAKLEPYSRNYVDLEYVNLYLLSNFGKSQMYKHKKATAQPSLSMGTIRDIDLIIPPIDEQKEIVKQVAFLFNKLDRIKELNTQDKETVDLLNKVILKEMFSE